MGRWSQIDFRGGLNSDDRFAKNTLSRADDVLISSDGELIKRGCLVTNATISGVDQYGLNEFLPATTASYGGNIVGTYNGASSTLSRSYVDTPGTYVQLGNGESFFWDDTSVALQTQDYRPDSGGVYSSTVLGEELFFKSNGMLMRWGGANAVYASGSASAASGQNVVTGSGTPNWSSGSPANVGYGNYFTPPTGDEPYRIVTVWSSSLILDRNIETAFAATSAYKIQPFIPVCNYEADWGERTWMTHASAQNAIRLSTRSLVCSHAGRLLISAPAETPTYSTAYLRDRYERIRWSALDGEGHASISWAKGADYWHEDNWVDVGSAGRINKMLSLSDTELLVVKSSELLVLRGALGTGIDLGHSISHASQSQGGIDACKTKIGAAILSENDVLIYDQGQVRSIVDGRIRKEVEALTLRTISTAGERIVCSDSSGNSLVFDIPTGSWSKYTFANATSRICNVKDTSGSRDVDVSLMAGYSQDWQYMKTWDTATRDGDQNMTTKPSPIIRTQPIPMYDRDGITGRPNTLFIDYMLTDAATNNPTMTVKVISGRAGSETSTTMEYTLGELTGDGPARIPINGIKDTTHIIVELSLTTANTARDFVLYGLWLDYEESDRVG